LAKNRQRQRQSVLARLTSRRAGDVTKPARAPRKPHKRQRRR
jgi:hypothetical protein